MHTRSVICLSKALYVIAIIVPNRVLSSQIPTNNNAIKSLARPHQTRILQMSPNPLNQSAAHFENGFLLRVSRNRPTAPEPNVFLYNAQTDKSQNVVVWPEGATSVWIAASSVSSSGQLAVSGRMIARNGTAHYFMQLSGASGTGHVIETTPYLATQLCQTLDGSIWTIGAEPMVGGTSPIMQTYDRLRRYDSTGHLTKGYLSSQDFTPSYKSAWQYAKPIYLRSDGNNVLLYDEQHGLIRRYDSSTQTLTTYTLDSSGPVVMHATGLGFLSDGSIYATRIEGVNARTAARGLFRLLLDDVHKTTRWLAVPNAQVSGGARTNRLIGSIVLLLGSGGQDLVYRTQGQENTAQTIVWSTM